MRKIFAVLAALICCLSVWTSVPAAQAFTLDKEDGEYSIQVELEGGSGKASVTSPTLNHCEKRRSNCRYPVEQF